MKLISAFRAMGAAFALVLVGAIGAMAVYNIDVPNGPSLGSQNINPFTLANGIAQNNQMNFQTGLVANNTTQALCTAIGPTVPVNNFITVASSGAVCLPQATAGRDVYIMNNGANTIQLFGSNTPFTPGTQDTINGTAGSTAYQGITTTNLVSECIAFANGVWGCASAH